MELQHNTRISEFESEFRYSEFQNLHTSGISFRNHLANICYHEQDFQIKVTSANFFATSHGKTENDAHGGTVK